MQRDIPNYHRTDKEWHLAKIQSNIQPHCLLLQSEAPELSCQHTFWCNVRKIRGISGDFQGFFSPHTSLWVHIIAILIQNLYFFNVSSLYWVTYLPSLCCIKAAAFILQNPSNFSPVFVFPFILMSNLQQNMCSLNNNSIILLHMAKEIIQMKNLGFP